MERETLQHMLRDMSLSRTFEERAAEEYSKGKYRRSPPSLGKDMT